MLRQPAARVLFVSIVLAALAAQAAPALTGNELGLIINEADPLSVLIGEYYARKPLWARPPPVMARGLPHPLTS
jgi:hypothetical protein